MWQQNLWIGIGFQKGSSQRLMAMAIQEVLQKNFLDERAIAGLATIDKKASDTALRELCHLHHWLLKTFSAEHLSTVTVPNPSAIITKTTGTPSIAEAAAILAATKNSGLSPILLVPKYICRLPEEPGAVTIAVAAIS
jgi:cobalamin biosynthesis protein CbiG